MEKNEEEKAWDLLCTLIDGFILRDEASLDKKEFIEEAKKIFKLKIIPLETTDEVFDYFDLKRLNERTSHSQSKKLHNKRGKGNKPS